MKGDGASRWGDGWRRCWLALSLCFFALAYGAPTSHAAHTPHVIVDAGCLEAEDFGGGERSARHPSCCLAHCLLAAPVAATAAVAERLATIEEQARLEESREGRFVPVPSPPPRARGPA